MGDTKSFFKEVPSNGGRPKLILTEEGIRAIETLAGRMCSDEEIASILNVDKKTLYNKNNKISFSTAKEKGMNKGKSTLRSYQFALAKKNATMAIWLGKQILNQRDVFDNNISSSVTPEININVVDNSNLEKTLYENK